MKFLVDDIEVFELLSWQKDLIKNDIPSEIFESDMHRRAHYSAYAPVEKAIHRNEAALKQQLKQKGVSLVPGDLSAFTEFVGSRKDMSFKALKKEKHKKAKADGKEIFSFSPAYQALAKTFLKEDEDTYLTTQFEWVFKEKIKGCLRRMHLEWDPKLAIRSLEVPLDDEEFVNLVTSQPDYKNRSAREAEDTGV